MKKTLALINCFISHSELIYSPEQITHTSRGQQWKEGRVLPAAAARHFFPYAYLFPLCLSATNKKTKNKNDEKRAREIKQSKFCLIWEIAKYITQHISWGNMQGQWLGEWRHKLMWRNEGWLVGQIFQLLFNRTKNCTWNRWQFPCDRYTNYLYGFARRSKNIFNIYSIVSIITSNNIVASILYNT